MTDDDDDNVDDDDDESDGNCQHFHFFCFFVSSFDFPPTFFFLFSTKSLTKFSSGFSEAIAISCIGLVVVSATAGEGSLVVVSHAVPVALVRAEVVHSLVLMLVKLMVLLLLLLLHAVVDQGKSGGGVGEVVAVTRVVVGSGSVG